MTTSKMQPINPVLGLDNVEAILTAAEMSFASVVRLNVYATDVRFGNSDDRFVTTVLGVTRLAAPELLVLLQATAVS